MKDFSNKTFSDAKIKRMSRSTMFIILFVLFTLLVGITVGTTYSAFQNTAQSNGTLSFAINGHQGTLDLSNTKVANYNSTDLTLIFTLASDTGYNNPTITNISMGGSNLTKESANFKNGSNIIATYSSSTLTIYRAEVTGALIITGSSTAQTYTISYNSNGGSGTMADTTANYNSQTTLRANTFTRTGYRFLGWSATQGGNIEFGDGARVRALGNTTLYAVWEANELTFNNQNKSVTFNSTAQNITFTGASNGTGSYEYSITAGNDDSYFSISGATITAVANAPVGSYNLAITATDGVSAKTRTVIIAITINPITLGTPIVSISNIGVVTWNTITGASSYDISIDGTTWTSGVSSGYDYFNTIVAGSGTRTVRVRANPSANYDASKIGSASITTYAITVASGGNGIARVSRTNTVGNDTTLNFITGATAYIFATPNSGYHFTGWTKDAGNAPASTTTANTTVLINANATYTATFTINSYTITVNVDSTNQWGTVNITSFSVNHGTLIYANGNTLRQGSSTGTTKSTATPNTNTAQYSYSFTKWRSGSSDITSGNYITITADTTITAHFGRAIRNYTVTINTSGNGSVNNSSVANLLYGSTIKVGSSANILNVNGTNITATANSATAQYTYSFSKWTQTTANGTQINTTGFQITGDATVYAVFTTSTNQYTITISAGTFIASVYGTTTQGAGSGSTSVTANYGTNVYLYSTLGSATGYTYTFSSWSKTSGSGSITSPGSQNGAYITINGNATVSASATCSENQYTYNISITGSSSELTPHFKVNTYKETNYSTISGWTSYTSTSRTINYTGKLYIYVYSYFRDYGNDYGEWLESSFSCDAEYEGHSGYNGIYVYDVYSITPSSMPGGNISIEVWDDGNL